MSFKSIKIGFLALTLVAILAVVGLSSITGAVPGAGKSGNPPDVEPATTLQNLIDCCQNQATIAEYQDFTNTNKIMGTCTTNGITAFRTGGISALQSYIDSTCGGVCTSDADCDDGNSCTTEFCSTGLHKGCITGIPVGDGISCQIDGQLGVCEGATCVPSGETCVPVSEVDGSCLDQAVEVYESCLNAGGEPEQCRQRMEQYVQQGCEGACADLSWIQEAGLPQCCTEQALNEVICGVDAEWVVGVAAIPTCYIQDS